MDTHASWTRPVAMHAQHHCMGGQKVRARFAFKTCLGLKFRTLCTIVQLSELRYGYPWQPDHTVLSFEISSLRVESWLLFARQTSDLFDKKSF